uniref:AMP-binding enzyme C-terminal domain-containing protein n=1 Tax=Timema bartmani TaxID=61472 RepID=A0A7R9ERH1_9NEOP|nr:unnamed protein product [Timema bartmani]
MFHRDSRCRIILPFHRDSRGRNILLLMFHRDSRCRDFLMLHRDSRCRNFLMLHRDSRCRNTLADLFPTPTRTCLNTMSPSDQFVLTEDGYGRIVGRLKEMINRGGENIFPKEIEDFLQTHPDILEAQVFGVDDVRLGEVVACSLRLKEGSALTQEDIRAYCKGMIAHFKIPKYFKFVTEFSKTSSGKIQKFKLKEEITKELESQKSFGENNSQLSTTTGAGESRK